MSKLEKQNQTLRDMEENALLSLEQQQKIKGGTADGTVTTISQNADIEID